MKKYSAGILVIRKSAGKTEILLGHMGGPFWAKKEDHAWTIPKGEFDPGRENPIEAARREFLEETGIKITDALTPLDPFSTTNKKHYFFTVIKDLDSSKLISNSFELEWPPKSGKISSFPELDRFAWFDLNTARDKMIKGQIPALDQLIRSLDLKS